MDGAAAAVSQAVGAGWASFDPCVMLGHPGDAAPSCSSAAAASTTLNGREVCASLRLAAPPAASYVLLDTDDCVGGEEPEVVAADGGLLLIHMLLKPQQGAPSWESHRFPDPDNFFVYNAGDPEWPWLQCLPSLGGWSGVAHHTDIVARCGGGGKDFFVADLQPRAESPTAAGGGTGEVVELFRYSSATQRWELRRLDMPSGVGPPLCFDADAVFAFDGRMCWADYHLGILLCDVAADDPSLRFVRFPLAEFREDFSDGRGFPAMHRTACVSGGRLWFVDVDDGRFRRRRARCSCSSGDGTITTWTLRTPEMEWTKEHSLRFSELWSHREYRRSPLPRSTPRFPIVDMRQDGVLHFIVEAREDSSELDWTITVDMRKRRLASYELYQNAIEVPEADGDVSNIFFEPLICCELGGLYANALDKPAGD